MSVAIHHGDTKSSEGNYFMFTVEKTAYIKVIPLFAPSGFTLNSGRSNGFNTNTCRVYVISLSAL
jgi:hypothetical protein